MYYLFFLFLKKLDLIEFYKYNTYNIEIYILFNRI